MLFSDFYKLTVTRTYPHTSTQWIKRIYEKIKEIYKLKGQSFEFILEDFITQNWIFV